MTPADQVCYHGAESLLMEIVAGQPPRLGDQSAWGSQGGDAAACGHSPWAGVMGLKNTRSLIQAEGLHTDEV
jgi:hypothetical protein